MKDPGVVWLGDDTWVCLTCGLVRDSQDAAVACTHRAHHMDHPVKMQLVVQAERRPVRYKVYGVLLLLALVAWIYLIAMFMRLPVTDSPASVPTTYGAPGPNGGVQR